MMSHKEIFYSEYNFESIVNDIKNKIEENFKITSKTTKASKRNIYIQIHGLRQVLLIVLIRNIIYM